MPRFLTTLMVAYLITVSPTNTFQQQAAGKSELEEKIEEVVPRPAGVEHYQQKDVTTYEVKKRVDRTGALEATVECWYTSTGKLRKEKVTATDGSFTQTSYSFDKNGRITKIHSQEVRDSTITFSETQAFAYAADGTVAKESVTTDDDPSHNGIDRERVVTPGNTFIINHVDSTYSRAFARGTPNNPNI